MNPPKFYVLILFGGLVAFEVNAQTMTKEQMIEYTPECEGERFTDGRPKIPDSYLERAKNISIEEAWGVQ